MLTISEIARKYAISNWQVQELIDYGYLRVARINRDKKRGISFLFAENEISNLDIPSLLAEIRDNRRLPGRFGRGGSSDFRKLIRGLHYYDCFMEEVAAYSEARLLQTSFYLFHLNHYAKTSSKLSGDLYALKNQVIKKMYLENSSIIQAVYLLGPDRYKIWLCEDCKEAAGTAGISYNSYIKRELYCPKCSIQSVAREYYSLVEFSIRVAEYRFTFHLPRSTAARWMQKMGELPQGMRKTGHYEDRMYLYGRPVTHIEEQLFPLTMIKEKLVEYLEES